jgi:hypothetical protein
VVSQWYTCQQFREDESMKMLRRWFSTFVDSAVVIDVDYSKPLYIPIGASGLSRHRPVGTGRMSLLPHSFELREMPLGMTYDGYFDAHGDDMMCDAAVLDGIVAYVTKDGLDGRSVERRMFKLFGDFRGQVFFLGTSFTSPDNGVHVPYLNVRTNMPCPAIVSFISRGVYSKKGTPAHAPS